MKRGAIILCGGESQRMGADKATLPFGPEQMLQRMVRIVTAVVPTEHIAVVASVDQQLPPLPSQVQMTHDRQSGRGPLEGLACGLAALSRDVEAVFLTGCDSPLLTFTWIEKLFSLLDNCDIVVPQDGEFHHPLSAVYRCQLLVDVEAALSAGQLALHKFIAKHVTNEVPAEQLRDVDPDLLSLRNLNTREDYLAALQLAGLAD